MLSNEDILRYSRQILLPQIGIEGQLKIQAASVLVVGAGGLGSPLLLYLAAAGIGSLGIVDYDVVEQSNLQRQVIHTESSTGTSKTESASKRILELNSNCKVRQYHTLLDSSNALPIVSEYNIICDCSDNPATRYLINDASIILKKILVSSGALRMDGQLSVYGYKGGPCYRCLFPMPPPADTVVNCSAGGVLGVITGIMGSLQALEVLKLCVGMTPSYSKSMLIFDGVTGTFTTIKLRNRNISCAVCGDTPTITALIDYPLFCGSGPDDKVAKLGLLQIKDRISVEQLKKYRNTAHLLLDVRQQTEYDIAALKGSIHIPLRKLEKNIDSLRSMIEPLDGDRIPSIFSSIVYIVCKHGNDSQIAVINLKKHGIHAVDVIGGLDQWAISIDQSFPRY